MARVRACRDAWPAWLDTLVPVTKPDDPAAALFAHHPRRWQDNRYVYPVISRRSQGLSIGVNLNPDKVCNFDCVYCSVDRQVPPVVRSVDLERLREELDHLLGIAADGSLFAAPPFDRTPDHLRRINDVAFSGDGEPTACPHFAAACHIAAELVAQHRLDATRLVVITNATLLDRPAVRSALAFLDDHRGEVWAKLDAGTEAWFRRVDRSRIALGTVLANIRAAGQGRELVIQSLFCRIAGDAPDAAEIAAWCGRLRELVAGGCRIRLVQVYTTARATAVAAVAPLAESELTVIADQVRALGLPVAVYP
jgi:wyosine [tRNA(Phe)-imidazoG37] synthetase (radical SAM superfamily)